MPEKIVKNIKFEKIKKKKEKKQNKELYGVNLFLQNLNEDTKVIFLYGTRNHLQAERFEYFVNEATFCKMQRKTLPLEMINSIEFQKNDLMACF